MHGDDVRRALTPEKEMVAAEEHGRLANSHKSFTVLFRFAGFKWINLKITHGNVQTGLPKLFIAQSGQQRKVQFPDGPPVSRSSLAIAVAFIRLAFLEARSFGGWTNLLSYLTCEIFFWCWRWRHLSQWCPASRGSKQGSIKEGQFCCWFMPVPFAQRPSADLHLYIMRSTPFQPTVPVPASKQIVEHSHPTAPCLNGGEQGISVCISLAALGWRIDCAGNACYHNSIVLFRFFRLWEDEGPSKLYSLYLRYSDPSDGQSLALSFLPLLRQTPLCEVIEAHSQQRIIRHESCIQYT
ncbi:hypothetical protein FN846DRAFT_196957 [Sphaerosporella brunnea]|uniref:Uncharacterized protein n=1 Tax=Sphaerosporella brunnea TaxID=1250544 RepID=A0A5J5EPT3_9PEZI|nr:hypothetical protein FN846DRAFT_196957 [Sphaerosporella brunnea]